MNGRISGWAISRSTRQSRTYTPFGTLLHFRKYGAGPQPRVLIVAPMAGHFVTLLRDTVQTMLPDFDVFVTDWKNARDVPRDAGRFGLDEYIEHLIQFLGKMGKGAHVLGVCQPCNALLAAVAVMAQSGNRSAPRSLTLMAGPVDTRIAPDAGEQACQCEPDRMVRAQPDHDCAAPVQRRASARLSGLRAAVGFSFDEYLSAICGRIST